MTYMIGLTLPTLFAMRMHKIFITPAKRSFLKDLVFLADYAQQSSYMLDVQVAYHSAYHSRFPELDSDKNSNSFLYASTVSCQKSIHFFSITLA